MTHHSLLCTHITNAEQQSNPDSGVLSHYICRFVLRIHSLSHRTKVFRILYFAICILYFVLCISYSVLCTLYNRWIRLNLFSFIRSEYVLSLLLNVAGNIAFIVKLPDFEFYPFFYAISCSCTALLRTVTLTHIRMHTRQHCILM